MFNKIVMVGNLTRDIEVRYTQGGSAIAKTAIATSRKFSVNGERKEEVCFVDITFFGRSAEIANQYLRKGSKILVEGRLVFEQWVDQQGGKRSKHSVTVESMQMLDTKNDSGLAPNMNNTHNNMGGYPQQNGNYQNHQPHQQSYNNQPKGNTQLPQQPQYQQNNIPQQQSKNLQQQPQPATIPKKEMPQQESIPEIDIDEDVIPF